MKKKSIGITIESIGAWWLNAAKKISLFFPINFLHLTMQHHITDAAKYTIKVTISLFLVANCKTRQIMVAIIITYASKQNQFSCNNHSRPFFL